MTRITEHRDSPYWVHSAPDVTRVEPMPTTRIPEFNPMPVGTVFRMDNYDYALLPDLTLLVHHTSSYGIDRVFQLPPTEDA